MIAGTSGMRLASLGCIALTEDTAQSNREHSFAAMNTRDGTKWRQRFLPDFWF